MATRAVNTMAGFDWLKRGINLGRNNPRAIFGGAALLLVAVIGVAIVAGLVSGVAVAVLGNNPTAIVIGMLVVMLPVMVLLGMLMVGYLRLIDAVESGRPARALDVFGGFGDMGTSLRAIGLMLLVAIIQNLLLVGLLAVFAGGFLGWYAQMMQVSMGGGDPAAAMAQLPSGIGLAYLVMGLVGTFFFGVQSVGLGQVALRGRGALPALGEGFAAAFRNLLPLLMLLVGYIGLVIVVAIAVVLLVLLVGLLAKLVGAWLAVVIGVPLYLAFLLAMVVVMFGVMYHCWRDICGGDTGEVPAAALTA
ncbi:MAG: hypothetical protein ACREPV_06495 [Lysobacter sp.]